MLIIADARLPRQILRSLGAYGDLLRFSSQNITYASISGHPDIFFCSTPDQLITAPNTPSEICRRLEQCNISMVSGNKPVAARYPNSAPYNAFVNRDYLIHNLKNTDKTILDACKDLAAIHVKQAYTRCNLVEAGGLYITSDKGIENVLKGLTLGVFYVDPSPILLAGQGHGFFGGCAGPAGNQLFVTGRMDSLAEWSELREELNQRDIEVVELYDGPLVDGGSILFLQTSDIKEQP